MRKRILLPGWEFGKLTIIKEVAPDVRPNGTVVRKVQCRCKCGVVKDIPINGTSSCGCIAKELHSKRLTTHGMSHRHPLYTVWRGMKQRCFCDTDPNYEYCGRRGIGMCDEWRRDFSSFFKWAIANGWRKGLEIDRRDNNSPSGYCPGNCRFVTPRVNSQNRRTTKMVTAFGRTMCVREWSRQPEVIERGIPLGTLVQRLGRLGWDAEKALTEPTRKSSRCHLTAITTSSLTTSEIPVRGVG